MNILGSETKAGVICPQLSDRERLILCRTAEGKAAKELAAILVMSDSNAIVARRRVMDKLGLRNLVELAVFAFAKGITRLEP